MASYAQLSTRSFFLSSKRLTAIQAYNGLLFAVLWSRHLAMLFSALVGQRAFAAV